MITLTYASILGLIYIALAIRVIRGRARAGVGLGHGGDAALERDIRIHANFAEYVPLALILIGLLEYSDASDALIRWLGGGLVIARLLHIWGLIQSPDRSIGRLTGTSLTFLIIIVASVVGLYRALV